MLFTINPSANEPIAPGTYHATFNGVTPLETSKGHAYRWEFVTNEGKIISGLSDATNPPTVKNKTGKWLCALSGKPLTAGVQVDPDLYKGKKYFLVVEAHESGGKLNTFSPLG